MHFKCKRLDFLPYNDEEVLFYRRLLQIDYSSIAALNRICALSNAIGNKESITEVEKLNLTNNHFYVTYKLYTNIDSIKAKHNFRKALSLTRTLRYKQTIQKKIEKL